MMVGMQVMDGKRSEVMVKEMEEMEEKEMKACQELVKTRSVIRDINIMLQSSSELYLSGANRRVPLDRAAVRAIGPAILKFFKERLEKCKAIVSLEEYDEEAGDD